MVVGDEFPVGMCLFDVVRDAMVEEGLPMSALEGGPHVEHASRSLESPPHAATLHSVLYQVAAGAFDDT